jgi:hypothetical protein
MSDWIEQYYQERKTKKKGGPGSGHRGHAGRPGKRGGSLPGKVGGGEPGVPDTPRVPDEFKTAGAKVRFRLGGDSDTFEIRSGSARATGYWRNADFPGEYGKLNRGEIFYITAGERKRRGIGTSLARDALNLLRLNGMQTVNMATTTKEGQYLVDKLVREGDIELIRDSNVNKAEYRILRR